MSATNYHSLAIEAGALARAAMAACMEADLTPDRTHWRKLTEDQAGAIAAALGYKLVKADAPATGAA